MEGKNIVLTKKSENTENTDGVQQERVTVKGVVTDSKGEPIIGANILEKGTTNGIITNLDVNSPSMHQPMPLWLFPISAMNP